MATADQANMQLYQRLKQKFPDIPDHVIIACVHEHQNDLQNCISHLSHISASYQFNSATELALNKQDKDHLNHYEISRLYHHPVPQNKANNNQPRYLMQKSLPCDAYYSQMRKYSGTPPMMRGGGGYQMQGHPLDGHIQSAPVMPSSYEPFVAKVSVGGSASPIPPPLPQHPPVGIPMVSTEHPHHPGSSYMQNDFESQRRQYLYNQCDWEMHVSYNQALILHQRAQMRRLQQKLNGDKQILDTVRNEVSSMELELYNRFKPTKHPGIFDHDEIKKLREETLKLQVECYLLTREVDFLDKGQTALGETNEGFYDRLNPGQSGSIGSPPVHPNRRGSSPFSIPPPKRENYEEEQQWSCSTCTFLNNPALDKCEMCEMPRLQLASGFG